jgi:hypothetical protein
MAHHTVNTYEAGPTKLSVIDTDIAGLAESFDMAPNAANVGREGERNTQRANMASEIARPFNHPPDWFGGTRSLDQLVSYVREGWKDGAAKLSDMGKSLGIEVPPAATIRRRPVWSADGDSLDVDRALAGQWDSAYRVAKRAQSRGTPIVELVSGWGFPHGYSADQLFWSGAAMLVLTDILEEAGYRVRLVACALTEQGDRGTHYLAQKIVVKEPQEGLRIDALAGVLCHAGVYRTFAFRHRTVLCPVQVGHNMGRGNVDLSEIDECGPEFKGKVVAPGGIWMKRSESRDQAIYTVKRTLESIQAGALSEGD